MAPASLSGLRRRQDAGGEERAACVLLAPCLSQKHTLKKKFGRSSCTQQTRLWLKRAACILGHLCLPFCPCLHLCLPLCLLASRSAAMHTCMPAIGLSGGGHVALESNEDSLLATACHWEMADLGRWPQATCGRVRTSGYLACLHLQPGRRSATPLPGRSNSESEKLRMQG